MGWLALNGRFQQHVFPGRILRAIDASDAVTGFDARLGGRRVLQHPADDGGLVEINRMLVMHHVNAGKQSDGQQNVHRRAGDGDDEALPARMRHEFVRRSAARLQRILARHLHVAAERQRADAVVGIAAAEADQALAEADGEDVNPDATQFGGGIVAKLVHQNHDAEHHGHRNYRDYKGFHKPLLPGELFAPGWLANLGELLLPG